MADEVGIGDLYLKLNLANNFGVAYQANNQFRESVGQLTAALHIARQLGLRAYETAFLINIGGSQKQLGDWSGLRTTLAQLQQISASAPSAQHLKILPLQALLQLRDGDPSGARHTIRNALALAGTSGSIDARRVHYAAYQIYSGAGDYATALRELETVNRLDDEGLKLVTSNRAALLAAQFQFSAQHAQIVQLRAEKLAREVALERERAQFQEMLAIFIGIAAIIALSMVSALAITAMRARRRAELVSAELDVSNQRLERALAAKTEFLASTSHEIRTPLNGILGMAQVMLADAALSAGRRSQVELHS